MRAAHNGDHSDALRATKPLSGSSHSPCGELRKQLEGLFSVWSMDFGGGEEKTFEGRLNHRQMQDVGVTFARYGAAMAVSLSQAEFYLQGFPLKGGGSFVLDGAEGLVSRNFGIVGGPGADMRIKYSSDFEHLIVRIKPQRLTRTLSDLLGQPVIQPLRMESSVGPIAASGRRATSAARVRCA